MANQRSSQLRHSACRAALYSLTIVSIFAGAAPASASAGTSSSTPSTTGVSVAALKTDSVTDPRGLSDTTPDFSWQLTAATNGERQTAYRVIVATSAASAAAGDGNVWTSGKVTSSQSQGVPYSGPTLQSNQTYYWTVQVWDVNQQPSAQSAVASFQMGLLKPADWHAQWIGGVSTAPSFSGASWIWYPEGPAGGANMPDNATRYFRRTFQIPASATVTDAEVSATADDSFSLYVNGVNATPSQADNWQSPVSAGVARLVHPGKNTLAASATNGTGPAGLIVSLAVRLSDGSTIDVTSDGSWVSANAPATGWMSPGFNDQSWQTALVEAPYGSGPWASNVSQPKAPDPYVRDDFQVTKPIARATLHVTALGMYQGYINGRQISQDLFTPGFTNFPTSNAAMPAYVTQSVQYQSYDVAGLLKRGDNAIGALLGCGYYCGYLPVYAGYNLYGSQPWFLAQLDITYTDGTHAEVDSGPSWTSTSSPVLSSDIYMGDDVDAALDTPAWNQAGADAPYWRPVRVDNSVAGNASLVGQIAPSVRETQSLRPISMTQPKPGVYVFNLGQNIAGWAQLNVAGAAGTTVKLQFGEQLNPDGTVYNANYRAALSTDVYTLAGAGKTETFDPPFTFHGFQYIEVTGLPSPPTLDTVRGIVAHAALPSTETLHTSNPLVNTLVGNIVRTQLNNSQDFPTDCPQRDERLPWISADIQQFTPTGALDVDEHAYLSNWLNTVFDSQHPDGSFPVSAPNTSPPLNVPSAGASGWEDAPLIMAYTLWQTYGDSNVIKDHWAGMARLIAYEQSNTNNDISTLGTYGDWVSPDSHDQVNNSGNTSFSFIGTAYLAYDSKLMAQMATAIGDTADASKYSTLFDQVKAAFDKAFVGSDGDIINANTTPEMTTSATQTAYVMALYMNLLPAQDVQPDGDRLAAMIKDADYHLDTGYLGTDYLLNVLTDTGHTDVAYAVLEQTTYPSWGYEIGRGATTIWEHWDSIEPDGSFEAPSMNSFDHPADGGVGDWLYSDLAGISSKPESPGFRSFVIQPHPGQGVTNARASHESPYGTIQSAWSEDGTSFTLHVSVPVNTTATVRVPSADGQAAAQTPGADYTGWTAGYASYSVGSGQYDFTSTLAPATSISATAGIVQTGGTGLSSIDPAPGGIQAGHSAKVAVTVSGAGQHVIQGTVHVDAPAGWTVSPSDAPFTLDGRAGQAVATVHVNVTPAAAAAGGTDVLSANVSSSAGNATVQAPVVVFGAWPSGTSAAVSSAHAPNYGSDGGYRTYGAGNTIDQDFATFWNDDTSAGYPDTLTVSAPTNVTLNGIAFRSSPDGAPADFTVQTWSGSAWTNQATVTGNTAVTRWIPFPAAVTTNQVRVVVSRDATINGEFTRIAELAP